MRLAPVIVNRREKGIEGDDELDAAREPARRVTQSWRRRSSSRRARRPAANAAQFRRGNSTYAFTEDSGPRRTILERPAIDIADIRPHRRQVRHLHTHCPPTRSPPALPVLDTHSLSRS